MPHHPPVRSLVPLFVCKYVILAICTYASTRKKIYHRLKYIKKSIRSNDNDNDDYNNDNNNNNNNNDNNI